MIYTAGYAGHTVEQLRAKARTGAILDIRLRPFSRNPMWNKSALERTFGTRYEHIPALGNAGYKDGTCRIVDVTVGIARVRHWATLGDVVILCGCANAGDCHRSEIARTLQALGHETRELSW